MALPRILIAGLRGSGGKTMVSVGLIRAWTGRGTTVAPFKKGPDYIDAAWLAAAAGQPCRNLDLFLLREDVLCRSLCHVAPHCDLAVIEGNRGLFDGADVDGTYSTAELAKLLRTPVVLVADATKTTRTLGALVLGCRQFDPDMDLRGVILNRVGSARHESVLREVVRRHADLPVLGAIPRLPQDPFPARHLGLVPPPEHDSVSHAVETAARLAEECLDLEALETIARAAPPPPEPDPRAPGAQEQASGASAPQVRIGVFRDAAFQFYYADNLEALTRAGGSLIAISPLRDETLPEVDALYLGGGFPETSAAELAANAGFRRALVEAVEAGLPVYAECGGAVYLGESLVMGGAVYPMTGVLPARFGFEGKPQGHGYALVDVAEENPFYRVGESLRGHEFHYTRVLELDEQKMSFAFRVRRGYGVDGQRDGLCRKNVLASYCHVHALGVEDWAPSVVRAAAAYRRDTDERDRASQQQEVD